MGEADDDVVAFLGGGLADLRELAARGNETAITFLRWFHQDTDASFTMGAMPNPDEEGASQHLAALVGNTAHMFWLARLVRYMSEHGGKAPSHYSITFDIEWGELDPPVVEPE